MNLSLISTKPSRIANRLWLVLSDGRLFPFSLDDYCRLKLKTGQTVDESQLESISQRYLLLNYALNQIAISPKIKSQLLPKLKLYSLRLLSKYHFHSQFSSLPTEVIDYLDSHSLLSVTDYVQSTINRFRYKSRQYLLHYFRLRQIPEADFLPYLPSQDRKILQKILTQKKYQGLHSADYKTKTRLLNSLLRKGFAYNDIKSLIDTEPLD